MNRIRQVEDLLLNVDALEMNNLQRITGVQNVAVYGSTNIPLYTLMMHAMIPAAVSDHVWFRTPSATRQIYTKLFNLLTMDQKPGSFQGIHILSDAKDVQYENFQKRHVLGLNSKGKKSLRPISEVVLFTGNPETGREILRSNIRELAKMESKNEKQVFLAFGAGINPLVITKDAQHNMDASINAAMDSVMINSGQDCIAPNLVFVDENIADHYVAKLKDRMSRVKVDAQKRAENLITPLYFSESLDGLVNYKEQFKNSLFNPETATIDLATRAVTPHLFVFNASEFNRVPLKEHFAPFLVVFKYKDRDELRKMIEDTRVQNKVMYASIFGANYATPEVSQMVQMFQESRHTVSVNFSIYADESGNMPFGGLGPDSSTANLLEKSGDTIKLETAQKPLLFSEEAARFFSPHENPRVSTATQIKAKTFIADLLKNANQDQNTLPFHLKAWAHVLSPQLENRPTGINYLRQQIQTHGISRVYRHEQVLSERERRDLEDFYGLPLLFPKTDQPLVTVPGVVLHNGLPAEIPKLLNQFRGDVNPYLGRGLLAGLLKNKLSEYYLAEAIQPGSMAATESFETLVKNGTIDAEYENLRQTVKKQIELLLTSKSPITTAKTEQIRMLLEKLIQKIFKDVRSHYPQGAFFKNFGELATADLGIMITTFSTNPIHLAQQFVMRLNEILKDGKNDEPLLKAFSVAPYETGSKFIAQILENPNSVMVQLREELTKTEQGQNMEFRVSFIDGEPFNTKLRFSREFYPQEALKAEQFVRDFFAKAPAEIKHLSGGADVVFTRDGRTLFMEFNFGGSDGTLFPTFFIMDNHEATSNLLGKPTAFYQKMLDLAQKPTAEIVTFFRSLSFHLEPWNKTSLDSLSAVEFGRWYRDFKLREWQQNPSEADAKRIFEQIEAVLTSRGDVGEDLSKIIQGAKEFLRREGYNIPANHPPN